MQIYERELTDDATNTWSEKLVCTIHLEGANCEPVTKDICQMMNERYGDYCIHFITKGNKNESSIQSSDW